MKTWRIDQAFKPRYQVATEPRFKVDKQLEMAAIAN